MEFSLRNWYVRGTLCFLSQVEWTARDPDSKEGRISLQWLKLGSCFMSQDEGMSESPVETLEKIVGLRLISRRVLCVMEFLELRQERRVYSRVTAGMAIRNSTLFSEVRTPV